VLRQRFADGDAAKLPVLADAEALPDFLTALRAAMEAVQSARQLHPSVRQPWPSWRRGIGRTSPRQKSPPPST
ncbi:hypothetical protein, partial [Mitsuokella sp.]|uniref:hypothetical protein n=1 Tax=Mitsuokella sp. TaxID=2049034 RepID=UPI002A826F52